MASIGVLAINSEIASTYIDAIQFWGADAFYLTSNYDNFEIDNQMNGIVIGGSSNVPASLYGINSSEFESELYYDKMSIKVLMQALNSNIPILGLNRGMHLLNIAMGGSLVQDVSGHNHSSENELKQHHIWISPGSKLATVLGSGGRVRVNSLHSNGFREAQKAPRLLASAYSVNDFLIEGIESPDHRFVVGIQCSPERQEEVPRQFQQLFESLVYFSELA
jgi:putative glutamine amidotransferase